ncbi:MAG: RHS repeat protein [Nanoarchaeota archaeon]|nr:RHS repeat protein [Nanoarchaeota archaeon]MBU1855046.1 RHS repeat protein [Nanoarchaeota archaeon]
MLLFSIVLIPFSFAIVDSPNVNSEPGGSGQSITFEDAASFSVNEQNGDMSVMISLINSPGPIDLNVNLGFSNSRVAVDSTHGPCGNKWGLEINGVSYVDADVITKGEDYKINNLGKDYPDWRTRCGNSLTMVSATGGGPKLDLPSGSTTCDEASFDSIPTGWIFPDDPIERTHGFIAKWEVDVPRVTFISKNNVKYVFDKPILSPDYSNCRNSLSIGDAFNNLRACDKDFLLTRIEDKYGSFITINYDGYKISSIVDSLGRSNNFYYYTSGGNSGLLDYIVDYMGVRIDFEYDNRVLKGVYKRLDEDGDMNPESLKGVEFKYEWFDVLAKKNEVTQDGLDNAKAEEDACCKGSCWKSCLPNCGGVCYSSICDPFTDMYLAGCDACYDFCERVYNDVPENDGKKCQAVWSCSPNENEDVSCLSRGNQMYMCSWTTDDAASSELRDCQSDCRRTQQECLSQVTTWYNGQLAKLEVIKNILEWERLMITNMKFVAGNSLSSSDLTLYKQVFLDYTDIFGHLDKSDYKSWSTLYGSVPISKVTVEVPFSESSGVVSYNKLETNYLYTTYGSPGSSGGYYDSDWDLFTKVKTEIQGPEPGFSKSFVFEVIPFSSDCAGSFTGYAIKEVLGWVGKDVNTVVRKTEYQLCQPFVLNVMNPMKYSYFNVFMYDITANSYYYNPDDSAPDFYESIYWDEYGNVKLQNNSLGNYQNFSYQHQLDPNYINPSGGVYLPSLLSEQKSYDSNNNLLSQTVFMYDVNPDTEARFSGAKAFRGHRTLIKTLVDGFLRVVTKNWLDEDFSISGHDPSEVGDDILDEVDHLRNLIMVEDAEGGILTYDYDNTHNFFRIKNTMHFNEGEADEYHLSSTKLFNPANNRLLSETNVQGQTVTYDYDYNGRLIKATYSDSEVFYTHDATPDFNFLSTFTMSQEPESKVTSVFVDVFGRHVGVRNYGDQYDTISERKFNLNDKATKISSLYGYLYVKNPSFEDVGVLDIEPFEECGPVSKNPVLEGTCLCNDNNGELCYKGSFCCEDENSNNICTKDNNLCAGSLNIKYLYSADILADAEVLRVGFTNKEYDELGCPPNTVCQCIVCFDEFTPLMIATQDNNKKYELHEFMISDYFFLDETFEFLRTIDLTKEIDENYPGYKIFRIIDLIFNEDLNVIFILADMRDNNNQLIPSWIIKLDYATGDLLTKIDSVVDMDGESMIFFNFNNVIIKRYENNYVDPPIIYDSIVVSAYVRNSIEQFAWRVYMLDTTDFSLIEEPRNGEYVYNSIEQKYVFEIDEDSNIRSCDENNDGLKGFCNPFVLFENAWSGKLYILEMKNSSGINNPCFQRVNDIIRNPLALTIEIDDSVCADEYLFSGLALFSDDNIKMIRFRKNDDNFGNSILISKERNSNIESVIISPLIRLYSSSKAEPSTFLTSNPIDSFKCGDIFGSDVWDTSFVYIDEQNRLVLDSSYNLVRAPNAFMNRFVLESWNRFLSAESLATQTFEDGSISISLRHTGETRFSSGETKPIVKSIA